MMGATSGIPIGSSADAYAVAACAARVVEEALSRIEDGRLADDYDIPPLDGVRAVAGSRLAEVTTAWVLERLLGTAVARTSSEHVAPDWFRHDGAVFYLPAPSDGDLAGAVEEVLMGAALVLAAARRLGERIDQSRISATRDELAAVPERIGQAADLADDMARFVVALAEPSPMLPVVADGPALPYAWHTVWALTRAGCDRVCGPYVVADSAPWLRALQAGTTVLVLSDGRGTDLDRHLRPLRRRAAVPVTIGPTGQASFPTPPPPIGPWGPVEVLAPVAALVAETERRVVVPEVGAPDRTSSQLTAGSPA